MRAAAEPTTAGRIPPHNLEVEESLLGALMLSRDALTDAVEARIEERDFYKPIHGHVFSACWQLHSQGEPVDPVTVAEELRRRGLLDAVGGRSELLRIQASTPASANAAHYAQVVGELALLRRLIAVASDIAELGYETSSDVIETLDRAEQMVFEVAEKRVTDTMISLYPALEATMEQLETLYNRESTVIGVPTGYSGLDDLLLGLQPSQLVVVAARPGQGKCVAHDTLLCDPATGARRRASVVHALGRAGADVDVLALDGDGVTTRAATAFVDDGERPVFRVRTALGREVRTTACHPFLTPSGWRPLETLEVGSVVAVPRALPVEGTTVLPDHEVAVLAHVAAQCVSASCCFTLSNRVLADDLASNASELGMQLYEVEPSRFRLTGRGGRAARFDAFLDGLERSEGELPAVVETLTNDLLAAFLTRFLSIDGAAWISPAGRARVHLELESDAQAATVAHLLLRFGVVGCRRGATLDLVDDESIDRFITRIGLLGREPATERVRALIRSRQPHLAAPAASVAEVPRREPVTAIWWDEITAIEPAGTEQVYDLTVDDLHNFVADDFFVHNTSFALGAASHVALQSRKPVIFFSMEMSHLELTKRLLSSEARIDARNLATGRLTEAEWPKVTHAVGRLAEAPFYIDDNPHCTVMEMRARARRVKARHGDLGLIVVDYLQLMSSPRSSESRQVEVSEMSRGLKILARELDVPVMTLSQLNRQLEYRQDKRPMLADLRESGCLPASALVTRADGSTVPIGDLHARGAHDIEILTLDERYRLVPGVMSHVFPTGRRTVYEMNLASGRVVRATGNHPFLGVEGWSQLGDLRRGDRIAVPRRASDGHGTIPSSIWDYIEAKGLCADGRRAHEIIARLARPGETGSIYQSGVSRSLMRRIADEVGDVLLADLARSHVHWDRVDRVRPVAEEDVFDATVPGTHNFVADDVIVHNSIEQDADVVVFIYRDEYYNPETDQRGTAEILVAKHRSGPTGMTRLAFLDHYTKFANMARE